MEITVTIRQNHGRDAVYPVCGTARTFCELTGHAALTPQDLYLIRRLGYQVNVQEPSRPEWIYGK